MNSYLPFLFDLLSYTLPAAVVSLTAYYLLSPYLEHLQKREHRTHDRQTAKEIVMLRLQAYERLVLFLERIEPNQLVARVHRPGMTAAFFARELQRTVREEFEHNLAQQVYVSFEAWNKVVESKDAVNQLIELAGKDLPKDATAIQLSSMLFGILSKAGISPSAGAIERLKKEAHQLL